MKSWPTCDEVVSWLRDRDQPEMATVVDALRDSERRARQAAADSIQAYHAIKLRYEPPPEAPEHRSYLPPPESSD
jgi:hypothetical protein